MNRLRKMKKNFSITSISDVEHQLNDMEMQLIQARDIVISERIAYYDNRFFGIDDDTSLRISIKNLKEIEKDISNLTFFKKILINACINEK